MQVPDEGGQGPPETAKSHVHTSCHHSDMLTIKSKHFKTPVNVTCDQVARRHDIATMSMRFCFVVTPTREDNGPVRSFEFVTPLQVHAVAHPSLI